MDYEHFFDLVIEEENHLRSMGEGIAKDYQLCKALAACYELHDYLANILAGMEGEPEEC